jgi:ribosome-associated protein
MRLEHALKQALKQAASSIVRRLHQPEDRMQKIVFDLTSEFVEVNQLLKLVGLVDSGGAGKNMVASGVVSVDGRQELRKTAKIRSGQTVSVGDLRITVQ